MKFWGSREKLPPEKSPEERHKDEIFARMMSLIELRRQIMGGQEAPRLDALQREKLEEYNQKIRSMEKELGIMSQEEEETAA